MYEPPHWTKPPQVKLAKTEPADAPAKPSTAPSIEDLAETIKTLKDGLMAMAEQVAGLTARVDDLAHPLIVGVDHELPAGYGVKPEWVLKAADYPIVAAALAAIDTGPGGCANAIAEQEELPSFRFEFEKVERVRLPNDFLSKMEEDAASGRVRPWNAPRDETPVWWLSKVSRSQANFSPGFDPNENDPVGEWVKLSGYNGHPV